MTAYERYQRTAPPGMTYAEWLSAGRPVRDLVPAATGPASIKGPRPPLENHPERCLDCGRRGCPGEGACS